MSLRTAALLVALGAGCDLLFELASFVAIQTRHAGPVLQIPAIGLFCAELSMALLFAFLYSESSRRAGIHARATAALVAAGLMFVQVVCSLYGIGDIITTCRATTVTCAFSVPTAVIRGFSFGFLSGVAWMVLFLAFTEKLSALRGKMIPKLAALVAILDIASAIYALVADHSYRAHWYSVLGYGVWIYTAIALAIFAVVLYGKWDSRKPVHDIVLESA